MPSLLQVTLFTAGLVASAAVMALLEIEIEGDGGWACRLPTWRYESTRTRRWLGARAITGYHLYFQLLILLLAHLPYFLSLATPSLAAELRIIAFVLLFWVLEDFFWFVLNPTYGLRRFRRENIWWHAENWWGFMPRDYWIFTPIAVLLLAVSYVVS